MLTTTIAPPNLAVSPHGYNLLESLGSSSAAAR
jgi:hypothetical protein